MSVHFILRSNPDMFLWSKSRQEFFFKIRLQKIILSLNYYNIGCDILVNRESSIFKDNLGNRFEFNLFLFPFRAWDLFFFVKFIREYIFSKEANIGPDYFPCCKNICTYKILYKIPENSCTTEIWK